MNHQSNTGNKSKLLRVSPQSSSEVWRYMRSFLVCMISLTAFVAPPALAGGGATFDHTEFNFGQLPVGSFASHTFWIHASGADTVFIDTVIPGCGCTTIPLSKKTLAPGDSVAFEVLLDSKGLMGSVAKRPGFRLRGDTTKYDVKFYASVITKEDEFFPLSISPPLFPLPEEKAREGVKFPFNLHNLSDEDIAIKVVDFPSEIFDIELANSIPAEGTITGHFALRPGYPKGQDIYKSMTIEVNNSQLYRLTAPIVLKSAQTSTTAADSTSAPVADSLSRNSRQKP